MEFEILQDLIKVITPDKLKRVEVLGNEESKDTFVSNLYSGILEGRFSSDEDAAISIYGQEFSKNEYRKLRVRLIRQLINLSFFIIPEHRNSKAFHYCYEGLVAACILNAQGASLIAEHLLSQVLEQGIKYELTEINAEVSRMLRRIYSETLGRKDQYDAMAEVHYHYEKKRQLEIEAFNNYEYIISHYVSGRSASKIVNEYAKEVSPRLIEQAKIADTVMCYYYTYAVRLIEHLSCNDTKKSLLICQEALDWFKSRGAGSKGLVHTFLGQKIVVLTQLRQFDESLIDECNLIDISDANWLHINGIKIPFFITLIDYEKALRIYLEAKAHPRFPLLSGIHAEIWKLYAGYLQLLAALDQLDAKEVETTIGKFKPTKFTNDFLVLNKEKVGMNIPILLLPIIFSILEGRFLDFGRSVEALNKYRLRYLENDINQRSACFMKMLLALSEMQHAPEVARKKIQVELEKLKQEPIEMSRQSYAIEVIPYEDLWQMLSEKMKIVS